MRLKRCPPSWTPTIEENLPGMMEVVSREGNPWQWIHGPYKDVYEQVQIAERMGMGSRQYNLVDVLPVKAPDFTQVTHISAKPV